MLFRITFSKTPFSFCKSFSQVVLECISVNEVLSLFNFPNEIAFLCNVLSQSFLLILEAKFFFSWTALVSKRASLSQVYFVSSKSFKIGWKIYSLSKTKKLIWLLFLVIVFLSLVILSFSKFSKAPFSSVWNGRYLFKENKLTKFMHVKVT